MILVESSLVLDDLFTRLYQGPGEFVYFSFKSFYHFSLRRYTF